MPAYPSQFPPVPQQYQQANPQSLQMLLAYLLAQQAEGGQQPQMAPVNENISAPLNPYNAQPNRPSPAALSPLGRFNDMVLRQSAQLAGRTADAKSAVSEGRARQQLVDAITHPPPAAPYTIARPDVDISGTSDFSTAPATLQSRYGKGGVSFAPPGQPIHGRFGPEGLQFGQIGGAGEAQPTSGDPSQTTFQQEMIMDSIAKALGKKKAK